jgi:hypothetical protein
VSTLVSHAMRGVQEGFNWFGLKTGVEPRLVQGNLSVWFSKPSDGGFGGLGLKTIDSGFFLFEPQNRWRVWSEDAWHHREACVEMKRSPEGVGSVRCTKENLDIFTPEVYLGCVLHVRTFWIFARRIYIYIYIVLL